MEKNLVKDYLDGVNIYDLCSKYKIGKIKVKNILADNNVPIRKRGGQKLNKPYIIDDHNIEKYPSEDGYYYEAICKKTGKTTTDYLNHGGHLTTHIRKEFNIEIPTLYDRREYYKLTGNYWWEQWFDIVKVKKPKTKKCPYCDWETIDVDNKSGWFSQHLMNEHDMDVETYLDNYPEDRDYFKLVNKTLELQKETDEDKFVECAICGKKLRRIDWRHLNKHNITLYDYKLKYGQETLAQEFYNELSDRMHIHNESGKMNTYVSKAETEIVEYLESLGVVVEQSNRTILNGQELDLYLPDYKIGIEYHGNLWHTEFFGGKSRQYHLNKTICCNENGVKLIQIFEDEYHLNKGLVLNKISHILKLNKVKKIYGRKCDIREITKHQSEKFLNENHIQGVGQSTLSLGAFYQEKLVAVMTFKILNNKFNKYDLTRFATHMDYNVIGIGGKLFKHFMRNYDVSSVISFADRRWTLSGDNNLYTKLGFELVNTLPPNYTYYNPKIDKHRRFHKFGFRKKILHKKYGLDLRLTETEMIKELGYDRIWDCGLFKYEYKK